MSTVKSFLDDPQFQALAQGLTEVLRSKIELDEESQKYYKGLEEWAERSFHSNCRMGGLDPSFYSDEPL